jgi:hypothetical protein
MIRLLIVAAAILGLVAVARSECSPQDWPARARASHRTTSVGVTPGTMKRAGGTPTLQPSTRAVGHAPST